MNIEIRNILYPISFNLIPPARTVYIRIAFVQPGKVSLLRRKNIKNEGQELQNGKTVLHT